MPPSSSTRFASLSNSVRESSGIQEVNSTPTELSLIGNFVASARKSKFSSYSLNSGGFSDSSHILIPWSLFEIYSFLGSEFVSTNSYPVFVGPAISIKGPVRFFSSVFKLNPSFWYLSFGK